MAGDWIKWTKGLAIRREVAVLASIVQRDRHEVAGRLMTLWEWCDDNIADADVDADTPNVSLFIGDKPFEFLDALLGLQGMAAAMASPRVRWIEVRSGGLVTFPNLARHNGTSAKSRAYEAQKKQRQRAAGGKPSPEMSPDDRDKTGTREEKKRVFKKEIPPNPLKGEPGGDGVQDSAKPEGTKRAKKAHFDPTTIELPDKLNTEAFRKAWVEWCEDRRERGKAMTERAAHKQLATCEAKGPVLSIAAIDMAIEGQWTRLWFDGLEVVDGQAKKSTAGRVPGNGAGAPTSGGNTRYRTDRHAEMFRRALAEPTGDEDPGQAATVAPAGDRSTSHS